jgi:hypothetical protein
MTYRELQEQLNCFDNWQLDCDVCLSLEDMPITKLDLLILEEDYISVDCEAFEPILSYADEYYFVSEDGTRDYSSITGKVKKGTPFLVD